MIEHNSHEHDEDIDIDSLAAKGVTNFYGLCEGISKLDSRIAGALAIREGKLLATSNGAGATLPSDEYLSKLIRQAEILVGIPLANKPFFGELNFTLVSYERLDSMLFYLNNQKAILGVGLLPPYDMNDVSNKIQKFLKQNSWLRQTYTIA